MSVRYFSDFGGNTVELTGIYGLDNAEFAKRFPDVKGRRSDSFSKFVGYVPNSWPLETLPVMRVINYKSATSQHKCDSRCIHATGRTMNCECSCGGANHGKGH
jgi:hypothetical protein